VDLAGPGDLVLVAQGSYLPLSTVDRTQPLLRLKEGVAVYGGFAGYEAGDPAGRNRAASRTVLDGGGSVDHVIVGASRARLDGFTLTGGSSLGDNGGAMSNVGIEGLTVAGCAFIDNDATGVGGAVHNVYSRDLLFSACLFTGNIASWGGAVADGGCGEGVRFVNCTFARNSGWEGAGAALVDEGFTAFVNCILWDNFPCDGAPVVRSGPDPTVAATFTDIDSDLVPGEGNLFADPLFSNAGSRDFRLLPGSPCVDAGSLAALAGSLDAGKTPVPLDGDGDGVALPDLGAFELDPEAR
jgi:hypothetical protein